MIAISLELRVSAAAAPPHAFFIPSDDSAVWLGVLVNAAGSEWLLDDARLFIVPTSRRNLTVAGLFVIPPATAVIKVPERALAYTATCHRIFHPVHSVLFPPPSQAELDAILTFDVAVFHPAIGIIGFAASDAVAASNLLAHPPRRDRRWNLAVPGLPPPQPLTAIHVHMPPTVQLLEDGRDGIATESPRELPRLPGEPILKPLLLNMRAMPFLVSGSIAKFFNWKSFSPQGSGPLMAPQTGGRPAEGTSIVPSWLLRMLSNLMGANKKPPANPSRSQPSFLDRSINDRRARELERLLSLLKQSPDDGLRHAIPLGDTGAPRGLARPGANLGPHDVNFSLNNLRGGGPVDAWNIPPNFRAQLQAKYRELANRELNLGRFRRAAFIFAKLLGDLSAAAGALRRGRLYREAAVLYKEKLNQTLLAAQCLEEGGLLTEAIELYVVLQDFEKIGGLYHRLERPADAAIAYRQRVAVLLDTGQITKAAQLLENKLHAPEEALEVLDLGWPGTSARIPCLRESFRLRAQLARHDESMARIKSLVESPAARDLPVDLAAVFSSLSQTYPDASVKMRAADATRVLAGNALPTATPTDQRSLLKYVAETDPADVLLSRDGNRYTQQAATPAPKSTPTKRTPPPTLVRSFALPEGYRWSAALSTGDHFYACGDSKSDVMIARCNWAGGFGPYKASGFFPPSPAAPRSPQYLLAPVMSEKRTRIVVHEVTTSSSLRAGSNDLIMASPALSAGAPLLGLCADETGATHWAITGGDLPALSSWDMAAAWENADGGMLRATYDLQSWIGQISAHAIARQRIPLIVRRDHAFFAVGSRLVHVSYFRTARHFDLTGEIIRLAASDALSRMRVAAVSAEHCLLVFADGRESRFAEGMNSPIVTFTRGGALVARDDSELRIYHTNADRLSHVSTFPMSSPRPIAMIPTPVLNEFTTVDISGAVNTFRIDT